MRLLHHKAAAVQRHEIVNTGETDSGAGVESKISAEQPNPHELPSLSSPKRHRRRIENFLSKHAMSPPLQRKGRHRRRANSWHGGLKRIHFFHHDREPTGTLHGDQIIPNKESLSTGDEQIASQNQTNMPTVDEEPMPLSIDNDEIPDGRHHNALVKPTKGNAFLHFFKTVEDFLFQRHHPHSRNQHEKQHVPEKKDAVLLYGCQSVEEHHQKVKDQTDQIRLLHGKEGLKALNLEYRLVPCDRHKEELQPCDLCCTSEPTGSQTSPKYDGEDTLVIHRDKLPCHECMQRLFHIPSGVVVNEANRKQFCADGNMYEEVTRLCQEYAQDCMCQEGDLEWHTVETVSASGQKEDIRMMVSKGHTMSKEESTGGVEEAERPTLLIATGRGKVRAGIFSRRHMMCSGLESATAIPLVREAAARGIHVIVLDPNVHGDTNGFVIFTKCMDYYYHKMRDCLHATGLYVVSHSASGGHMARYLLDKSDEVLTHFRAIAFTDSTHNIQWTKKKGAGAPNAHHSRSLFTVAKYVTDEVEDGSTSPLQDFLESERCVYFRCANVRRGSLELSIHPAGEPVQTDAFWTHRFGKIRTFWAGTDEHSLTNWYAHAKIWEHFDYFLLMQKIIAKSVREVQDFNS
jgi:hypothetical protein